MEEQVMKTINKVRKTVLAAAAIMGLAIMSITANAQFENILEKNDRATTQLAMATATSSATGAITSKSTNSLSAYLVIEKEEPLHLADWMVGESNFWISALVEPETESPLKVEEWMTSDSSFTTGKKTREKKTISTSAYVFTEITYEGKLTLKYWMFNPKIWK